VLVCLEDDLTSRRGGAEAVALFDAHERDFT